MNLIELNSTKQALKKQLAEYERINPSCSTCLNFSQGTTCTEFKAAPPPEWVAGPVECEKWSWDEIPFNQESHD